MYAQLPPVSTKLLLASLLCLALAACNQDNPLQAKTPEQTAAAIAKSLAVREAAQKAEAAMAAMSSDELRKFASTAFREQRLYAPAGNNAVEFYLAIRKKSAQPDPLTERALMDLTPYTVIAAEQAISRLDFTEATRLRDLILQVDANAPAIPRISQAINDGLKNTEALALAEAQREKEKLLAEEKVATQTSQETLKPAIAETPSKPSPVTVQTPSSPAPAVNLPVQTNQVIAPAPPSRAMVAAPSQPKKSELVAIRTPDPDFPSDALNRGLSGAVEIEFVVQRSGEVSEVRVVNSSQRAFDRNVMSTVKRWKFAPLDEPMTVRRSFNFNNPS